MNSDTRYVVIAGAVLLLVFSAFGAALMRDSRAEERCLRHGYPRHDRTHAFVDYCVRTVDQTEIVVRLDSLEGGNDD